MATYIGGNTGMIQVGGFSGITSEYFLTSKFSLRETCYNKQKALAGIFRKHTIKKMKGMVGGPPMYTDTFNAIHNEEDLLTLAEATVLIEEALIAKAIAVEQQAIGYF